MKLQTVTMVVTAVLPADVTEEQLQRWSVSLTEPGEYAPKPNRGYGRRASGRVVKVSSAHPLGDADAT